MTTEHCTELYPLPFSTLVARLVRELDRGESVYNLRRKEWWTPTPGTDLSIAHVGGRVGTPLGPASGPHTQLTQNLVLSWLGGSRFMELKTVQILDALEIPRPCIFAPHVGYNVEWSQELRVGQSAEEYVKAWMLLHMLASEQGPGLWSGVETVFDMSLGYDLAGIQSDKVRAFIETLLDAGELIERFRAELPDELSTWRDAEVPTQVSGSTTLSTFHGCPADEIEAIATHTMRAHGLHTVIKLNPTLLGYERVRSIVQDQLGYTHIGFEHGPFEKDLQWAQLMDMLPRLRAVAAEVGVELGVKFSNTLVMQSPEPPFDEGEMYLSGAPLHVLALTLADEFRKEVGPDLPITFSAGIDAKNFPGCVAAGLGPVTTCTDLLKSRGYGRLHRYLRGLEKQMVKVGAEDIASLRQASGSGDSPEAAAASYLSELAEATRNNKRFMHPANSRNPKKVGSPLELFDCLTCDICIPVCPNGANFHFPVEQGTYTPGRVSWSGDKFSVEVGETLLVERKHQIGCTVDCCNMCGQCDVWCPEDGGPYLVKPNLFVSRRAYDDHPERDGMLLDSARNTLIWRRGGSELTYRRGENGRSELDTGTGSLTLEGDVVVSSRGDGALDLTAVTSMRLILDGFRAGDDTWLPPAGA